MIRFAKAALRGIKNELAEGESGWTDAETAALNVSGYASTAGQNVSSSSAMKLSAAWDCVRKTSQLISTLPGGFYDTSGGVKRRIENDLTYILTVKPNPDQTAQEFWEGMIAQKLLTGNAVAQKLFIGKRLVGLRPLLGCAPRRNRAGALEYVFNDRGRQVVLPADQVFHLRGFTAGDGIGLSVIKYSANSLGLALAADETAGTIFKNGLMASGLLTTDQKLDAPQRAQLTTLLETYAGSKRSGKTMILESGLSYSATQMNPEDVQLLESRSFNVSDVCRWFGVPPIIVGHSADGQTMWGSGVEQIMLSWLVTGINPQLVKIENRILADLVPANQSRRLKFQFDRNAMLQMDSKSKGEFVSKTASSATLTANERREILGLEPHDDPKANELLAQGAMVPLSTLGENQQ